MCLYAQRKQSSNEGADKRDVATTLQADNTSPAASSASTSTEPGCSRDESVDDPSSDTVNNVSAASLVDGYDRANHEPAGNIPPRTEKTRLLYFQDSWYEKYPWLHYSRSVSGVVCFICAKAHSSGLLKLETKSEPAFLTAGYCNWKKAIQKFSAHQSSACHNQALIQLTYVKSNQPVFAQLSAALTKQQQAARQCLLKSVKSVKYLLRQGLAFRGHVDDESNFQQLLKMQSETDCDMRSWLQRTTNFTSHECIEEI